MRTVEIGHDGSEQVNKCRKADALQSRTIEVTAPEFERKVREGFSGREIRYVGKEREPGRSPSYARSWRHSSARFFLI